MSRLALAIYINCDNLVTIANGKNSNFNENLMKE